MVEELNIVKELNIVEEFNKCIAKTHYGHYINGTSGLIDNSINASPNANQIYHLYSYLSDYRLV